MQVALAEATKKGTDAEINAIKEKIKYQENALLLEEERAKKAKESAEEESAWRTTSYKNYLDKKKKLDLAEQKRQSAIEKSR